MPLVCQQCTATNPPLSNFCHRCGATVLSVDDIPHRSASNDPEPTFRDVATDVRVLAVDTARYSAPRIKTASIFIARATRRSASYAACGIKAISTAIGRRANRPSPSSEAPVPETEPPPAASQAPVAPTLSTPQETPATGPTPTAQHAIACPRCRTVNQAGSIFCFNCGLPLDEAAPAARPSPYYTGRPAGFWVRLAAALIDAAILITAQLTVIAIWPGIPEYIESDSLLHWVDAPLLLLTALYYTVGVSVWSTTVGKRVLGLRVLRPDGSKISPLRSLARYFASGISFLLLGFGFLMIAFNSDKRALHDVICSTVVLRT